MFRFTIRDVLLATALVALSVGWWLDRRQLAAQRDVLLIDNGILKQDVARLSDMKRHAEQFVNEQRTRAEEKRQEAIAKLRERGIKIPAGADKPLYPEQHPSQ